MKKISILLYDTELLTDFNVHIL